MRRFLRNCAAIVAECFRHPFGDSVVRIETPPMRPEVRAAFEENWERDEAAHRHLGRKTDTPRDEG